MNILDEHPETIYLIRIVLYTALSKPQKKEKRKKIFYLYFSLKEK